MEREEINRLKSHIHSGLKDLQMKIKQQQLLASPYVMTAAGLRRRMPLNCLSCDKPVVAGDALAE